MEFLNGIPGNFVDNETGEQLKPMYKWQDAMGFWHQKELAECSWSELYNFGVGLWNLQMSGLLQEVKVNSVTWLDMLRIMSYVWTFSSLLVAILILVAMFVK